MSDTDDQDPYSAFLETYTREAQPDESDVGRDVAEAPPGEWRNVWVWIGRARDEIFPAALELVGKAREMADQLGARVGALVMGHDLSEEITPILARYGADVVYTADASRFHEFQIDVVREALVTLVQEKRPEILLFAATIQGRNLAAQVAARLKTGIVPNCEDLTIDTSDRLLRQKQPSFENRLVRVAVTRESRPQIATVIPGAFRQPTPDETRRARHVDVTDDVPTTDPRTEFLEESAAVDRPLERRDAVLAGGLGLGSKEAFERLEALGEKLDAAVVATRAAVACGWAPKEKLLTRQRKRIRPSLYVAFGVVGEYDHLKAVEGAEVVVAVTDDPNAPVCEMADFIAVGPPDEILEDVIKRIEAAQAARIRLPAAGA